MTRLEITVLGTFQASKDGEIITKFETVPTQALLIYLAMHPGVPFRREVLADLLWPEQPRTEALHALRQTLSRLRHAIGSHETSSPFLFVTRQTIQFDASSDFWLDVDAFDNLINAVDQHTHRRMDACSACIQRLTQASEFYHGDLLSGFYLDSLPFQEWLTMERERLHRQAMETLYELAECHNRIGDHKQAQHYARRQLALEPWCEEAHRQLMFALSLSGQRSAALAQYEACRRALSEELGVSPRAETTAFYEQIRDEALFPSIAPPHNLPAQITRFIGRETELEQIAEQLNDPNYRLLTLTGPGGIGKTRLARAAARQAVAHFPDGTWFVPLIDIQAEPVEGFHDRLATAIAGAMNFSFTGMDNPKDELLKALRTKESLIILDNFEHLVGGVDFVLEILRQAPKIAILVTSRTRLNVRAERLVQVEGLPIPRQREASDVESCSSIQLFLDRMPCTQEKNTHELSQIVRTCQILEGIPLAIELAAALTEHLSLAEIIANLQRDLSFLTTTLQDIPERHRQMQAVFESSWQLLSAAEQSTLAQLAVFSSDFDRAAALAVTGAYQAELISLIHKSLLQHVEPGRYALHALVRQFAAVKLAQFPELAAAHTRHSIYYLTLVSERAADLQGDTPQQAAAEIRAEIASVRQAWLWRLEQLDTARDPLPHIAALDSCVEGFKCFYLQAGLFQEGDELLKGAADRVRAITQNAGRFSSQQLAIVWQSLFGLLEARGDLLVWRGDHISGVAVLQEADAAFEKASATSPGWDQTQRSRLLVNLGTSYNRVGDCVKAVQYLNEGLAQAHRIGASQVEIMALITLSQLAGEQGNYAAAKQYLEKAVALARELGNRASEASVVSLLASISWRWGEIEQAGNYVRESLSLYKALGDRHRLPRLLNFSGVVAIMQGNYDQAEAAWEEGLSIADEMGDRLALADMLTNVGYIHHHHRGNLDKAKQYYQRSLSIAREIGHQHGATSTLSNLGHLHVLMGDYEAAWKYLREALCESTSLGVIPLTLDTLVGVALLRAQTGQVQLAAELAGLVLNHPAMESDSAQLVETVLADLRKALPERRLDAALERGKTLALDEVVAALLGEG
ncbi:MAG: tetratricopeptide repeat protein [Anaerolineae bacterium]|nr:tetratricopeptide repeat protein [Anaerolineae bacterium]